MTALAGAVGAAGAGAASTAAAASANSLSEKRQSTISIRSTVGSALTAVKFDSQIAKYGDKVKIGMGIADTDFRSAPCIGEAMAERLQHENWGYLSAEGFAKFREVIAEWNHDRYGLTVDPTTLQIATGVHPGLIASIRTFVSADE